MGSTLVAYFSATGTTRRVAEMLAAATGADLLEIVPKEPYTASDLDWRDHESRSSLERAEGAALPELASEPGDLSAYATVFVGFPVWWSEEPRIIDTFLTSCDLTGRRIAAFGTSGGSGLGGALRRIKALVPDARIVAGKTFNATVTEDSLRRWANVL